VAISTTAAKVRIVRREWEPVSREGSVFIGFFSAQAPWREVQSH
jgi:hypothetical protein